MFSNVVSADCVKMRRKWERESHVVNDIITGTDINTGKVLYQDSDSAPKPWNTGWKEHRCVDGILSDASGPESDHTYSDANTTDGMDT